jgi:hypothetical protein
MNVVKGRESRPCTAQELEGSEDQGMNREPTQQAEERREER